MQYEVANGVRIPNLGEKKLQGYSEEGTVRSITTQVCEVNKGLLSVRKVVEAGNRVSGQENARAHVYEGRGRDVHVEDVRQERRGFLAAERLTTQRGELPVRPEGCERAAHDHQA